MKMKPLYLREDSIIEKEKNKEIDKKIAPKRCRSKENKGVKLDNQNVKEKSKSKKNKKAKDEQDTIVVSDDSPVDKSKYIPTPVPNREFLKLWTQTYEPKSLTDLIGLSEPIDLFKRWLLSWHETFNQASGKSDIS